MFSVEVLGSELFTTFGELSGDKSERIIELNDILKSAGFPVSISSNKNSWQKSHLAMVIPMANAIYFDGGDNYSAAKNRQAICNMSLSLKEKFNFLKSNEIIITPAKLNISRIFPVYFLSFLLKLLYKTRFAETLISNNENEARHGMSLLNSDFQKLDQEKGIHLEYLILLMFKYALIPQKNMICLYEIGTYKCCRKKGIAKRIINKIVEHGKLNDVIKYRFPQTQAIQQHVHYIAVSEQRNQK